MVSGFASGGQRTRSAIAMADLKIETRPPMTSRTMFAREILTTSRSGVFDVDGVLRGKYISKAKFFSALESGFGFCDVVLGWDSNDQLYDNVTFTGWHTAYPDAAGAASAGDLRGFPFEGEHAAVPLRIRRRGRGRLPAR